MIASMPSSRDAVGKADGVNAGAKMYQLAGLKVCHVTT